MTGYTLYRGATTEIRTGGTSQVALYGPMAGGFITNPPTTADQGITPLLSYTTVMKEFLAGPFNTFAFNSLPEFNDTLEVEKNTLVVSLGPPEVLYVSMVGPASIGEGPTTTVLYPGQTFLVPRGCTSNVWVNAATSGHRFSAVVIQPATQYPPTLTESSFPPAGPTGLLKALPAYLYQEYAPDDDLQAFVMAYNDVAQEYVDWFNNLNLPVYQVQSGGLLDWVGQGLYGIARPTLYSNQANLLGPFDTMAFNTFPPLNGVVVVNNVTNITVTSDDVYKRIITWAFYKGDGKQVNVEWLKRRIYRFLYGASGWNAVGPTYQISVLFSGTNLTITLITGVRRITDGALFNQSQFNSIGSEFNSTITTLETYPAPALALIFQEAIATGVLEMPYQFNTTCRIGIVGDSRP